MKRWILCLVLVFGLAPFSYLVAQGVQVEQLNLGSITDIPTRVAGIQGYVVPLTVSLADSSWNPKSFFTYYSGTVYMQIAVVNLSSSTKSFKLEYDLRCADGASYYVYRTSKSVPAGQGTLFRIAVTSYVAKLGLITLTGRVYGTGMGNDNKVTSQAYVD